MEINVDAHTLPGHRLVETASEITPVTHSNRRDRTLEEFLATFGTGQRVHHVVTLSDQILASRGRKRVCQCWQRHTKAVPAFVQEDKSSVSIRKEDKGSINI